MFLQHRIKYYFSYNNLRLLVNYKQKLIMEKLLIKSPTLLTKYMNFDIITENVIRLMS
jgi:hypothetical protein